jgi:hypothetical protein
MDIHIEILHAHTVISWKTIIFSVMCKKKMNFGIKRCYHVTLIFVFFTQVTKNVGFHKTWCAHIKDWYVSLFNFFLYILKYFFPVAEAYALMCRFEFLVLFDLILLLRSSCVSCIHHYRLFLCMFGWVESLLWTFNYSISFLGPNSTNTPCQKRVMLRGFKMKITLSLIHQTVIRLLN